MLLFIKNYLLISGGIPIKNPLKKHAFMGIKTITSFPV
jgi:hypothetical protein